MAWRRARTGRAPRSRLVSILRHPGDGNEAWASCRPAQGHRDYAEGSRSKEAKAFEARRLVAYRGESY